MTDSIISAAWMAAKLNALDCIYKYLAFLKSLIHLAMRINLASDRTFTLRIEACSKCPLYFSPLGTCGEPGDIYTNPHTGRPESFGCWCVVDFANRFHSKDCWGRVNGLNYGWPDEIRPAKQR